MRDTRRGMRRGTAALATLALVTALGGTFAAEATPDDERSSSRTRRQVASGHVFTNADLEALAPLPTQTTPIVDERLDPNRVREFIDRQYARIDADRRYRLEQASAEARLEELKNPPPRYGLALAPYWPYGFSRKPGGPDRSDRPHAGAHRPLHGPTPDFANRIVPLHARPTLAERGLRHGVGPQAPRGSRGATADGHSSARRGR